MRGSFDQPYPYLIQIMMNNRKMSTQGELNAYIHAFRQLKTWKSTRLKTDYLQDLFLCLDDKGHLPLLQHVLIYIQSYELKLWIDALTKATQFRLDFHRWWLSHLYFDCLLQPKAQTSLRYIYHHMSVQDQQGIEEILWTVPAWGAGDHGDGGQLYRDIQDSIKFILQP